MSHNNQHKENPSRDLPQDRVIVIYFKSDPIDSAFGKSQTAHQPRFSFRVKHSEFELFIPDTVDGEFIF